MKDESYFEENDFQRIRAKSTHGSIQSEFHIPTGCLSCDGESGRGRHCLGVDCPIFPVQSKETDGDQYIEDLLADRRTLKEALLDARMLKESLRTARLLNLVR